MTCTACGTANKTGRKFCSACGTPLAAACPNCGTPYEPDERFCGECGAALPTNVPAPASVTPPAAAGSGGEVRQVSVLFCDLVGYTALSEQRDAEDVRELLSGYFDTARRVVDRYGGSVEKFIGDAVMAVWGSPVAREDDAERAVRAALDLVAEVEQFGEQAGIPDLRARAGIVTGQAASIVDPREGLVVGDRVNTAARIQSTAEPGTVFVDDVTKQVTAAAIAYADAGLHAVKGKAEPLQLWRAVRVVAGKGGAQRIDGLEAAFVGRGRELNLVKELFHASVEDGRARLVTVTGQAGVGKSRLRWEFDKYVDGLAFGVRWHSGRCLSYGEGVAYWALAEMVRQRLGVAEDDPNDVVRAKIDSGLVQWISDPSARTFLVPRLGPLLGVDDSGLPREELFAGWRLFFEQLAAEKPVVMVFEDMQWADSGLLDFLEQLLDWSAAHPIFVLAFARPELQERRPDWMAGRRNVTPIYLDPLPDPVMVDLLEDLVPGLPAEARERIIGRAEGIPLYAVETVRGLIDRDLVVPREGVYTLVGEIGDLNVPASLTALIGARLDALSPDERSLVRALSVLGGTFPLQAISAVVDVAPDDLDAQLQSLLRKEVLTVRTDPLSPDRGQYAFVQSLMRAVAADTLTKRERKTLHLKVADHLRTAFDDDGEDVIEVIAAHYRDAYEAAANDPDAGEIRAQAAEMFTRAARRAESVGAPENAEQAYLLAAELTADEEAATDLRRAAGDMALLAGRYGEAEDHYVDAEAAHRAAGRDRAALELAVPMSQALGRNGDFEGGSRRLREALDVLPEDDPYRASVLSSLAWSTVFTGNTAEAFRLAEDALVMAQAYDLRPVLMSAAGVKALACSLYNRVPEALILYRWALELMGQEGDAVQLTRAHNNCGDLLLESDQPGAREHFETVMDLAGRVGDRPGLLITVANLMLLDILHGTWDDAEERGRRAVSESAHVTPAILTVHFHLACLAAWRGEVAEAQEHARAVRDWADSDDLQDRTTHDALVGLIALAQQDFPTALTRCAAAAREANAGLGMMTESFRFAWPLAVEAGLRAGSLEDVKALLEMVEQRPIGHVPPFLRAQAQRGRALLDEASGATQDVESGLTTAIAGFAALDYRYWQAVTQTELGEWLVRQGRSAEAAPLLAAAGEVLTQLRARPMVERAQGAVSGVSPG